MTPEMVALIVGLFLGGIVVWFLLRPRIGQATAQAKSEAQAERAALTERVQAREQEIADLKSALRGKETEVRELRDQISQLQEQLREESEKRASAEQNGKRIPELQATLAAKDEQIADLQGEISNFKAVEAELRTTLEKESKAAKEKLALLDEAKQALADAFDSLSARALQSNNQSFLDLAKTTLERFQEGAKGDLAARQKSIEELVKPLKDSLEKVDGKIQQIEQARTEAYATLTEQVKHLAATQTQLKSETAGLVKALRAPQVRGRWGEIQLKRVVEMAGMLEGCDFAQQESISTEDGRLRPDLIVRLPGNKKIVVDAKAPLYAYLEALETPDEDLRKAKLKDHARQIREHLAKLGQKSYWEQFKPTPEFVVMFLPGETFFSAALEQDPSLIEFGANQQVILSTPTTLISLLRAVAYGWRQERLAENAQAISDLARELYKRLSDMADHWADVGRSLGTAVSHYNKACGTLESRVLVSARKFQSLQAAPAGVEIEPLRQVEHTPRLFQAPELLPPPPGHSTNSTPQLDL